MTPVRRLLATLTIAGGLAAVAPTALACTIDQCRGTREVCAAGIVDCDDLTPVIGCHHTAVGELCIRDPFGGTP